MFDELKGRVVLVTGASSGIGTAVARAFGVLGARVAVHFNTGQDGAQKVAAGIAGAGGEAMTVQADLADPAGANRMISAVAGHYGAIDVLVNNAGATFDGFDSSVVERTLAVNLWGVLRVTDALAPLLHDGGSIVNVSSGMGNLAAYAAPLRARFAAPALDRAELRALVGEFASAVAAGNHARAGWPTSAYRVSKAALNAFTRISARELAPRGITVTAVDPGWVQTRMGGRSAPRTVTEGADTIAWLPCEGRSTAVTGRLYFDRAVTEF